MKKALMAILILVATSVSGYYVFVWTPKAVATEAKVDEDDLNIKNDKINVTNEDKKKKTSIIKDPTKTVGENMLNDDKEKINEYKNKLSVIDSALVDEYMESKDDENSIKEMVRIFKGRLGEGDYNSFKLILNKYIDVNSVEKEILK